MDTSDPEVVTLRAKVRAALEEFDQASAFHEAWKPTAYDEDLHRRMGSSYATNTFLVIRAALRRETLLALIRLWDRNSKAVSLSNIARALGNGRVVDALVAECEAQWGALPMGSLEDILEENRATVAEAVRRSEEAFGREQGEALRQRAAEAITLIAEYDQGGARHGTLRHLRTLRDQHLAHRQLRPKPATVDPADASDEAVERLFEDMARLIHLLRLVVEGTDYRPEETAEFRRRHAKLFWASVRGERTEGHPDYALPRGGGR
jgi:hypothetical protein